ncbi:glycosyltransferase family 2 protein [Salipiger mangrovisoli]|uniref:Glycosyltransferase family 2 protein n=1 Tax=Salipiger mangrovisoli TaxID=2865933 RepID=A0ABR9WYS6_9RHOB|nr:glycosyltransferase family 2 protein [Salipiger mangrovisoli]MBE9636441.1 glycosyltransferase family 2 protein [Salipiger mangrovisoli]
MQTVAAAITMVRDDVFFLKAWLRHYGRLLGRENCYVINHGRGAEVAELAEGCNVIGIPGDPHPNFDMKRWRLLNGHVNGLRSYYRHVIVGDVDELVVLDPAAGNLLDFLAQQPLRRVLTPVGLELIHRPDCESLDVGECLLGPRRFLRHAPHYSKPCVLSLGTKIARGGHFSQASKLNTPEPLYLIHLKYCDYTQYVAAMDRRNRVTQELGVGVKQAAIGQHWFAEARGEDSATFAAFAALPLAEAFDFSKVRRRMHRSWKPRGETGYWQFDRPEADRQYVLPDRFFGLV